MIAIEAKLPRAIIKGIGYRCALSIMYADDDEEQHNPLPEKMRAGFKRGGILV